MHPWIEALRQGAVTGSVASVVSALALAWRGRREDGDATAPVNAISHWVWHPEALHRDGPSTRHTVTGYLVHHGASVFWGVLHARALGLRPAAARPLPALAGGMAAAALACFVDLRLTPDRLTPGFEHRLSRRSLALTYGTFGLGLGLTTLVLQRAAAKRRREGLTRR